MIELEAEEKMQKSVEAVEDNLKTIRTGRANPQLLDRIEVEYYGAMCQMNQVANVTTPDSSTVMVTPFDKGALADIDKAIQQSDVGIMPNNDGSVLRLNIPQLSEERRKELSKTVKGLGEDGKVAARNVRQNAIQALRKREKDGTSKDIIAGYTDSIEKLTAKTTKEIDEVVQKKEKEVMTI